MRASSRPDLLRECLERISKPVFGEGEAPTEPKTLSVCSGVSKLL